MQTNTVSKTAELGTPLLATENTSQKNSRNVEAPLIDLQDSKTASQATKENRHLEAALARPARFDNAVRKMISQNSWTGPAVNLDTARLSTLDVYKLVLKETKAPIAAHDVLDLVGYRFPQLRDGIDCQTPENLRLDQELPSAFEMSSVLKTGLVGMYAHREKTAAACADLMTAIFQQGQQMLAPMRQESNALQAMNAWKKHIKEMLPNKDAAYIEKWCLDSKGYRGLQTAYVEAGEKLRNLAPTKIDPPAEKHLLDK